jgi:hypothetical protein
MVAKRFRSRDRMPLDIQTRSYAPDKHFMDMIDGVT